MYPEGIQTIRRKRNINFSILLFITLFCCSCQSTYKTNTYKSNSFLAYKNTKENTDKNDIIKQEEKHSKGAGFELVISETLIHEPDSGNVDPSTEIHLTYWLNHDWALGLGYSFVFEEDGRVGDELAVLLSHKPWPILTLNAGPSFAFPDSEHELELSAYFEGELNIKIGKKGLHTGPVLGSLIGNEFRWFGGIHIGYEF